MRNLCLLFVLFVGVAPVSAAPVTTANVERPTTATSVSRPTTAVTVNHPSTAASVVRPTTAVPVLRPVTAGAVSRPTTQVEVKRPGETGVSYVPSAHKELSKVEPAASAAVAETSSPAAVASTSGSSSGGSYTPSYKQAKDFSASSSGGGLGMNAADAAAKEGEAKNFMQDIEQVRSQAQDRAQAAAAVQEKKFVEALKSQSAQSSKK